MRTRCHPRALALLLAAVALLDAPAPAAAQSASELLEQGIGRFNRAEFTRSRRLLLRAAQQLRQPKLLGRAHLYLGLNHAVLGETEAARQAIARSLGHDPTLRIAPPDFKRELVELVDSVRAELRGTLVVSCSGTRATVQVDERPVGRTPSTTELPIGTHRVLIEADGGRRETRNVVVYPGRRAQVTVRFAPSVPAPPPDARTLADPVSESAPPTRRRLWTWVAAGAGAVALAVGIGLRASAGASHDDWIRDCRAEDIESAACADTRGSIETRERAAWAMLGVAGALGVGAIVLFFVEGRAPAEQQAHRGLDAAVLPTGAVVRWGTSF